MRIPVKSQAGFTLVELVVAMALMVMLLTGFAGLLSTSVTSWVQGSNRTEVQQVARHAVDMMVREIQYSQRANLVFNSATRLTLQTSQYGAIRTITYFLDTTASPFVLRRLDGGDTRAMTGANVDVIAPALFTNLGGGTVGINLFVVSMAQPAVVFQVETAVTPEN